MPIAFVVRQSPRTCEELSAVIGFPVLQWTKSPEFPFDLELDVPSLTPGERVVLLARLEAALTRLEDVSPPAEPEPAPEPPIDVVIT